MARVPDSLPVQEAWPELYEHLRGLAYRHLRRYSYRPTSVTSLVHEAYIRLARSPQLRFNDLEHCARTASQAMRWILVEQIRESRQMKRGGGWSRIELGDLASPGWEEACGREESLAMERAIRKLMEADPRGARVVTMRALGMEVGQIALALGVSERTVRRDWNYARIWLQRELEGFAQ